MFKVEMLPAHHGDCILIEYGDAAAVHRVLIDGGTPSSYADVDARLAKFAESVDLELLVVTHVDEDHIGGTLKQLVENPGRLAPKDVWFNAYKHLAPPGRLGPPQGEGLSTAIEEQGWAWNAAFKSKSVVVPTKGALPTIPLDGGAVITLLSPTWETLGEMISVWKKACKEAGLVAGKGAKPLDVLGKRKPPKSLDIPALCEIDCKEDPSKANGTSIAFLFEYDGKRVLLGADAHADVVLNSLERLQHGTVSLDAFKLCHHGSSYNFSDELLAKLRCDRFLVSTNGEKFGHPYPETLARIVALPGEKNLCFNYDTDYTRPWTKASLRKKYGYEALLPEGDDGTFVLDLS